MSEHNQDKETVVNALGGKKGLIDSGIPSVVFLLTFNFRHDLQFSLISALALSLILAIVRLAKKDTIQHAISGVLGVVICAFFANRSGNPSDFYIPKLLINLAYGSAYLIANLAGWPILGVVLGPLLGENFEWRKNPERKRVYIRASWIWVAMFFARIAVQYPIYRSGIGCLAFVGLATCCIFRNRAIPISGIGSSLSECP